jgi:type VI secretion system protein ImpK
MKRITELTKDFFNALNQIRGADDGQEPSPELVHSKLRGLIDAMLQQGAQLAMPDRDVQDIAYALVALADERALAMSEAMHQFWMANTLQLRYFHENVAGDGFFSRLDGLRKDLRRLEVLEVYYLCLLFGFQGKFAIRGGDIELANLIDLLRSELGKALDIADELSPSAERPDDAVGRARGRTLIWVSAGAMVLTLTLYIALRVSIANESASLREPPAETAR